MIKIETVSSDVIGKTPPGRDESRQVGCKTQLVGMMPTTPTSTGGSSRSPDYGHPCFCHLNGWMCSLREWNCATPSHWTSYKLLLQASLFILQQLLQRWSTFARDALQPVVSELLHTLHAGNQEHQCAYNIRAAPSLPLPASPHPWAVVPTLTACPRNVEAPQRLSRFTEHFAATPTRGRGAAPQPPPAASPKCKLGKTLRPETTAGSRSLIPLVPFFVPVSRGIYRRRAPLLPKGELKVLKPA